MTEGDENTATRPRPGGGSEEMEIHEVASASEKTDDRRVEDAPGYQPIENYGIIGDLHTTALVGMDGSMGTQTTRAAQDDTGKIILTVATSEGERTLDGTYLLMAAGPPPNIETLNLDAASIEATNATLSRRTRSWRPPHPASTPSET